MVLIIAHRGASALAPENTLAAFRRAVEDGAEGIEFDVRLAKDGEAVVHHDASLKRTGGEKVRISELTATELETRNVGRWFQRLSPSQWHDHYANETVPRLSTVLESLNDYRGKLYVELKCTERDVGRLVSSVCRSIENSSLRPQIVLMSFRLGFMPHTRRLAPGVRTAALFAPKIMSILRREKYMVDLAAEFGADEIAVHYSLVTKKLIKNAERRGLPLVVWTVNHPRWVKRAAKLGIAALITNNPARLLERRGQLQKA